MLGHLTNLTFKANTYMKPNAIQSQLGRDQVVLKLLKCSTRVNKSKCQCIQIGLFLKDVGNKFSFKVAQIFGDFLAILKNGTFPF